jgi:hypothetical protein
VLARGVLVALRKESASGKVSKPATPKSEWIRRAAQNVGQSGEKNIGIIMILMPKECLVISLKGHFSRLGI